MAHNLDVLDVEVGVLCAHGEIFLWMSDPLSAYRHNNFVDCFHALSSQGGLATIYHHVTAPLPARRRDSTRPFAIRDERCEGAAIADASSHISLLRLFSLVTVQTGVT